jgi:nucleoid DNA-binding protein
MNHKELVAAIASKMNLKKPEIENILDTMVQVFREQLSEGKTIGLHNFGNFEVRKKEERLSVHPATQVRTLIPPKLVVNFKQSNTLKEKINKEI